MLIAEKNNVVGIQTLTSFGNIFNFTKFKIYKPNYYVLKVNSNLKTKVC